MEERVYSPESLLGHPTRMVRNLLADLWRGRGLAWRLFVRDLSAMYRQTWLGYAWAFLPPLVNALTFVFLNSQGLFQTGATEVPYAAYAMIGTLLWQVFADAVNSPAQVLLQARSMLAKINFPREAILMAGLLMVTFNFLVRLLLLAAVMIWFKLPLHGGILFLPVGAFALMIAGFAVGLTVAPLGALYGDVAKALPLVTTFWMLLTPVVYPPKSEGFAHLLSVWNPVSPLIVVTRDFLIGNTVTMLPLFFAVTGCALLAVLIGLMVFRLAMPHLIARMGG